MKPVLVVVALFSIVIAGGGIAEILDPPYTDQELAASFVDTWEPHAIVTTLLLAVLALVALCIAAVYAFGGAALHRYSLATLILVVCAIASQVAAHIVLTNHVTRITGQTFGRFYGLL